MNGGMNPDWFYAANNQQLGPVSAADLATLAAAGTVNAATLVWTQGMGAWQPYGTVADQIRGAAGLPQDGAPAEERAVCAYSGSVFPKSEMVAYGDKWVSLNYKEAFLQALRDGQTLGSLAGVQEVQYVGFWWRVLAALVDGMVMGAVSMIFMIPMMILGVSASMPTGPGATPSAAAGMPVGAIMLQIVVTVLQYAIQIGYYTWMTGKYGATLGKMAIGAKVVNADGSKCTYLKGFARWAAYTFVSGTAALILFAIVAGIFFGGLYAAGSLDVIFNGGGFPSGGAIAVMVVGSMLAALASGLPYWMCALNKEKCTLHDYVCSTRVVKK